VIPLPLDQAGRRDVTSAVVVGRCWLSEGTFEPELSRPETFHFVPGQRVRLRVSGIERKYSLISASAEPTLALCIHRAEGGQLSPLLAALPAGAQVELAGSQGCFVFRPSQRVPMFVDTGTGVAPFVSMVRADTTGFCLLHGVRAAADVCHEPLFRAAARPYVPCVPDARHGSALPPDGFRAGSPNTWRSACRRARTISSCAAEWI
jgi:ferredoxin-NADP reductase